MKIYNDMIHDRLITESEFRCMAEGYILGLQAEGRIEFPSVEEVMLNTDEIVFVGEVELRKDTLEDIYQQAKEAIGC